jgi:hypothetical protein
MSAALYKRSEGEVPRLGSRLAAGAAEGTEIISAPPSNPSLFLSGAGCTGGQNTPRTKNRKRRPDDGRSRVDLDESRETLDKRVSREPTTAMSRHRA